MLGAVGDTETPVLLPEFTCLKRMGRLQPALGHLKVAPTIVNAAGISVRRKVMRGVRGHSHERSRLGRADDLVSSARHKVWMADHGAFRNGAAARQTRNDQERAAGN